jgi:hypothetical protein
MTVLRDAAKILDISEYDVLYHAYEHWYGKNAPTELINRAFFNYLKTQQPPHWARHYALDIIARFESEMNAKCKCFGLLLLLLWGFKSRLANSSPILIV